MPGMLVKASSIAQHDYNVMLQPLLALSPVSSCSGGSCACVYYPCVQSYGIPNLIKYSTK